MVKHGDRVHNKKIMIVLVTCSMLFAASFISLADENMVSATSPIEITDSAGHQITLSAPAEHVVTMGFAFTLTVMELGGADKIVGYDHYSTYSYTEDERMQELDGIAELGTGYNSNKESLLTGLAQLVDNGNFTKATDVVFINNFSTTLASGGMYDNLVAEGYNVICLGAKTYDGSIEVVETISKAIGMDSADSVKKMEDARQAVVDRVAAVPGEERPSAIYVSVNGGSIRIYNSGLAVSLIETCGATNACRNGESAYFNSDGSAIIQANPDVIFLDGTYNGTVEEFKEVFPSLASCNVVKLDKDWNNPCPGMAEGLEFVYVELYEAPLYDDGGAPISENSALIAVSVLMLVIIIAVAVVLVRRR
ncbi:MAG: ABC transporter substrate-binding protein [Candidatus Methanomethylophilaceae archaeon]